MHMWVNTYFLWFEPLKQEQTYILRRYDESQPKLNMPAGRATWNTEGDEYESRASRQKHLSCFSSTPCCLPDNFTFGSVICFRINNKKHGAIAKRPNNKPVVISAICLLWLCVFMCVYLSLVHQRQQDWAADCRKHTAWFCPKSCCCWDDDA